MVEEGRRGGLPFQEDCEIVDWFLILKQSRRWRCGPMMCQMWLSGSSGTSTRLRLLAIVFRQHDPPAISSLAKNDTICISLMLGWRVTCKDDMGNSLSSLFFAGSDMKLLRLKAKLATICFCGASKLLGSPLLTAVRMESVIPLLPVPMHYGVTILLEGVLRSCVGGWCWCAAASSDSNQQHYEHPSSADAHCCLRRVCVRDNCRLE